MITEHEQEGIVVDPWMRQVLRITLYLLAAGAAFTGLPAAFAPRVFYDSFPVGFSWVSKLPPYNEHLIVDVGGLYLGFAFLLVWCAITLHRAAIVPVMLAWIGVQAIHTIYHLLHLDDFSLAAAVSQTMGFALFLVLPCVALAAVRTSRTRVGLR